MTPTWQAFPVIPNVSYTGERLYSTGQEELLTPTQLSLSLVLMVAELVLQCKRIERELTFHWPETKPHCLLYSLLIFCRQYDWLSVSFPDSYRRTLTAHKVVLSKPYMIPTP
jgi:hypothetical protein